MGACMLRLAAEASRRWRPPRPLAPSSGGERGPPLQFQRSAVSLQRCAPLSPQRTLAAPGALPPVLKQGKPEGKPGTRPSVSARPAALSLPCNARGGHSRCVPACRRRAHQLGRRRRRSLSRPPASPPLQRDARRAAEGTGPHLCGIGCQQLELRRPQLRAERGSAHRCAAPLAAPRCGAVEPRCVLLGRRRSRGPASARASARGCQAGGQGGGAGEGAGAARRAARRPGRAVRLHEEPVCALLPRACGLLCDLCLWCAVLSLMGTCCHSLRLEARPGPLQALAPPAPAGGGHAS